MNDAERIERAKAMLDVPGADPPKPKAHAGRLNGSAPSLMRTPLYRLEALAEAPTLPVLLVQGQACADAAREALGPSYCVLAWLGAYTKTDFSPLQGRDVTLWPEITVAGNSAGAGVAGRVAPIAASLRVVHAPAAKKSGWNCISAIGDGADLGALIDELAAPVEMPDPSPARALTSAPSAVDESAYSQWAALGLACAGNGIPYPTADNVERVLSAHSDFASRVYFDTFRMRKMFLEADGTEREWVDADTLKVLIWMQRALNLPHIQKPAVRDGIDAAAFKTQRNSLTAWLDSLAWDGIERLPTFLRDVFHAEDTKYSADVGRCWLVSMAARAYSPGCQVDTMVVLESSEQGMFKSSALGILGGKYYAALPAAFGTRDFLQALDGMWLIEIPDMSGFRGRDIEHVKAIITTRDDRYCRRYAHDAETYPRQCVYAATANSSDWNEDPTGARRFLPVTVGAQIELDLLRQIRDQLFAEAVHRFKANEPWWDIEPTAAKIHQAARRPDDSWEEKVEAAINDLRLRAPYGQRFTVTVAQILDALEFKTKDQGKAEQMRMARILQGLGWVRETRYENGRVRKCWSRRAAEAAEAAQNEADEKPGA